MQAMQNISNVLNQQSVSEWVLFLASLFCMLIIGNPMIAWLQKKRWKKNATGEETWAVREDTPDSHQKKQGTPSMGGLGIIAAVLLTSAAILSHIVFNATLLRGTEISWPFEGVQTIALFLLPITFLAHGVLGFSDDWSKASGRGGLRARAKLFWQIILAVAFVSINYWLIASNNSEAPTGGISYALYSGFFSFAVLSLALIATCNAVNLTDGIDGLAAGLAVQTALVLFFLERGIDFNLPFFTGFFCLALAGACLGFLKFNKYKARVFMGDTGSLAIGAALGAGAILQGAVWLLPFIGFIYFVEMFSVIAQVAWFKWTKRKNGEGKRLLRRAPLHHHFELGGWSEWRVVGTFWAINLFTSAIGLWLWHAGVLPRWP